MNFIVLGKACAVRRCWKKVRVVCAGGGEDRARARRRDLDKSRSGISLDCGDCVHGNPGSGGGILFFSFLSFAGTWVKGGMCECPLLGGMGEGGRIRNTVRT